MQTAPAEDVTCSEEKLAQKGRFSEIQKYMKSMKSKRTLPSLVYREKDVKCDSTKANLPVNLPVRYLTTALMSETSKEIMAV